MTGTKTKTLPFWATLLTLIGIIVLCGLGTWQLQRLSWKNEILTKLDKAYNQPLTNPDLSKLSPDDYIYAKISGRFLFDKSILLGHTVRDETAGQFLITPLQTSQGTILINLGFNPKSKPLDNHALTRYNNQNITFSGLVRRPEWNSFTPENNPEKETWYRLNIEQISKHKDLKDPVPFVIYADQAQPSLSDTIPNNKRWQPNNNHAQYAFFWFTLAIALAGIYVLRFLRNK